MQNWLKEDIGEMKPAKITIELFEERQDAIDIRVVIDQVRDYFDLLTIQGKSGVVWKLVSASTNSPLAVEGTPVDPQTGALVSDRIQGYVNRVERCIASAQAGKAINGGLSPEKMKLFTRMLERGRNNFKSVHFNLGEVGNYEIRAEAAARSLMAIKARDVEERGPGFAHTEIGSVEGQVVVIGTHYQEPSIKIKERVTGREIACLISQQDRDEIQSRLTASDVWTHRRVRVSGSVVYDEEGEISKVTDGNIQFIDPKPVDLDALHDPDFTGGLPAYEYVNRLRENDFE